ncbi:MAG: maleylpyruvate isomerase N-terminal domain-containing protein [Chloroflexi bacterium]|jgi:hypothetical protein|nr:maleylpyruvate isomerase N-terminal domain-containing protein [Chloroflexota bacterium]
MYTDGLSFLEDEREAWLPFEALAALADEDFVRPAEGAHGWSGRDLAIHLTDCQALALDVARELAVSDHSAAWERFEREWEEKGGDAVNAEALAAASGLSDDEVRARLTDLPGELRGYLTVVPESRWVKNATYREFFLGETLDHYVEHQADLAAILAAAGR